MHPFGLFVFFGGWAPIALLLYACVRALPAIEEGQNWFVAIADPLGQFFRWPWFTFLCPSLIAASILSPAGLAAMFVLAIPFYLGPLLVLYSGFEGRTRLKSNWPLIIATLIAVPWALFIFRAFFQAYFPLLLD